MTHREKLAFLLSTSPFLDVVDGRDYGKAADDLIANGVTVQKWTKVEDGKPDDFVSVLGRMTDAGDLPAVRECYWTGEAFFFPALAESHPVDQWTPIPEPRKED